VSALSEALSQLHAHIDAYIPDKALGHVQREQLKQLANRVGQHAIDAVSKLAEHAKPDRALLATMAAQIASGIATAYGNSDGGHDQVAVRSVKTARLILNEISKPTEVKS
jgi:hypothetical protein